MKLHIVGFAEGDLQMGRVSSDPWADDDSDDLDELEFEHPDTSDYDIDEQDDIDDNDD